jgi:protein-arginine kinase activator protein McsA
MYKLKTYIFGSNTNQIEYYLKKEVNKIFKKINKKAEETYRILECPKCEAEFEDDGKEYPHGALCPECKGIFKGVIYPKIVKRIITQEQWDELKKENEKLKQKINEK